MGGGRRAAGEAVAWEAAVARAVSRLLQGPPRAWSGRHSAAWCGVRAAARGLDQARDGRAARPAVPRRRHRVGGEGRAVAVAFLPRPWEEGEGLEGARRRRRFSRSRGVCRGGLVESRAACRTPVQARQASR